MKTKKKASPKKKASKFDLEDLKVKKVPKSKKKMIDLF